MSWIKAEKTFIELKDDLFCFYRNEQKIFRSKYSDNKVVEEKVIIENCKRLNSVILGSDEKISVIVTSIKNELTLYILQEDEIISKVLLTKAIAEEKYMEIASMNNTLNIFYLNDINNVSTLSFRILNNKLFLTPSIVIDSIESKADIPYKISANNGKLFVCYLRAGSPNVIGYRKFDFSKNSWSNFLVLDNCYGKINSFNFITKGNTMAYSYTYNKQRKTIIAFGLGVENKINKGIVEEEEYSRIKCNIELINNDMKLSYLSGTGLKIKDISDSGTIKAIDKIDIDNIINGEKYILFSTNNISINEVMIVETDNGEIILDKSFIKNSSIERYQKDLGIKEYIDEGAIISSMDEDADLDEDELDSIPDIGKYNETKLKLKTYEDTFKKISEKLLMSEDERKKLLNNIDYLTEQLNKKTHTINVLEKAFAERQGLMMANERKITELNETIQSNQFRANSTEVNKLKENIKAKELKLNSYEIELTTLRTKVDELNLLLRNKSDEVKNLNNGFKSMQNDSTAKIATLNELIEINKIEKSNSEALVNELKKRNDELVSKINSVQEEYNLMVREVEGLKAKLEEQNNIIFNNNNEINILQNQVLILEEKNKESFIKKIFKNND